MRLLSVLAIAAASTSVTALPLWHPADAAGIQVSRDHKLPFNLGTFLAASKQEPLVMEDQHKQEQDKGRHPPSFQKDGEHRIVDKLSYSELGSRYDM